MANVHGKEIDKTHLSLEQAESRGFIHRDYIAHCLRWTHVVKRMYERKLYETARIIDVGCGKELPFAKLLYSSRLAPTKGSYTGVDVNRLELPRELQAAKWPIHLHGQTDFALLVEQDDGFEATFNVGVCFEVLEHVEPKHSFKLLQSLNAAINPTLPGAVVFISTPNYDPTVGAAANHVNEMTAPALGRMIVDAGFEVQATYGTFASQRDIVPHLTPEEKQVFDSLHQYYDSNYLATLFAPNHPYESRNILWELRVPLPTEEDRVRAEQEEMFPSWELLYDVSHSSSAQWLNFAEEMRNGRK